MASPPVDEISLCNLALDLLNEAAISTISPPSTDTEKICARAYPMCRRSLLDRHPWNFSRKRTSLAASAEAPLFDFTYKYLLPDDCIRVLRFLNSSKQKLEPEEYDYEGRYVLTDAGSPLYIYYISDIEDPKLWSPKFADLLSVYLAFKMAYPITGRKSEVTRLDNLFDKDYAEFMSLNVQERPPVVVDKQPTISARRSAGLADNTRYSI